MRINKDRYYFSIGASGKIVTVLIFFLISILILIPARSFAWDDETTCQESIAHYKEGMELFETGNFDSARKQFEKSLEISPHYAEAYVALGNVQSIRHEYDQAIISYQKAIILKPAMVEAHMGLGMASVYDGQYDLAALAYQHAIQLNYRNAKAYLYLGKIYKMMGNSDSAKASLEKARTIYKNEGDVKTAEKIDKALNDKRMDETI